jgi:electron transfer flavoprotein-quinone oxidoreductase
MSDDKFDSIVVGAGPAGVSAAIIMARAGLNVALIERGEYAGAKNVQGAVLYSKMLADIIPEFYKEAPLERAIVEERVWVMSGQSSIQIGYRSAEFNTTPANAYTIIRVEFDKWFSKKAEEAGVTLVTGVTISDVIKKDGTVVGVRSTDGDELLCDVLVACDGANSILAQKAGIGREWKASEIAIAVKEVLALPREKIEDRFNLEGDQGSTTEMFGDHTRGMLGYSFLYTNKETLAIGVGCAVDDFQRTNTKPYELLESIKAHPSVRRLIAGAKPVEYSAHIIPEGGYNVMPKLFTAGMLVAGDAAQMINPTHREGSNLAMAAGRMAGETVAAAKKRGDFSENSLSEYRRKLEDSFVLKDMKDHRNVEEEVRKRREILTVYPKMFCDAAHNFFTVDGLSKTAHKKSIIKNALKQRGLGKLAMDAFHLRQAIG